MVDIQKSGYYESPLGYNNVNRFVDEFERIENKMVFYSKNTKKDIIMTEEEKEEFNTKKNCRFFKNNFW